MVLPIAAVLTLPAVSLSSSPAMHLTVSQSLLAIALLLVVTSSASAQRIVAAVPPAVREKLELSDFYQQHVDADGIPILGSARVSKFALLEAAFLVDQMLAGRDDLRRALAQAKVRVAVMASAEFTTDIPEHAHLTPREHWNLRARGLGATRRHPCVSCGEENLLALNGDPYSGENILVHEFGHTIHELGLASTDRGFDPRLRKAYAKAMESDLWKDTYAATNHKEYWAEGVQSWFDCNQSKGGVHNGIRTRKALQQHDPDLSALLSEVFGDTPWRYEPPTKRATAAHLDGLNRQSLAAFQWPEELLRWKRSRRK